MTVRVQPFNPQLNILRALLWAHNDAENLQGLLQAKQNWYTENFVEFFDNWVAEVFDLRTANDFGLSVWSVILDLPLFGESNISPDDYPAFGFDTGEDPVTSPIRAFADEGSDPPAFGGNFAVDARGAFGISTEDKRLLLRLRYFQLITRGAIPEINRFLLHLFGPNEIYALDGLDMTMTYVIVGPRALSVLSLLQLFDILPRPAGVRLDYTIDAVDAFGFDDYNLNFDNGSFVSQG